MNTVVSARTGEHRYFLGAALALTFLVLWAFGFEYRDLMHPSQLTVLVQVHGLVMFTWVGLFLTQVALIVYPGTAHSRCGARRVRCNRNRDAQARRSAQTPHAARDDQSDTIRHWAIAVSHGVALLAGIRTTSLVPARVDTVRNRRLHPVFGWGAPSLILSLYVVWRLALTPACMRFAERLVS